MSKGHVAPRNSLGRDSRHNAPARNAASQRRAQRRRHQEENESRAALSQPELRALVGVKRYAPPRPVPSRQQVEAMLDGMDFGQACV